MNSLELDRLLSHNKYTKQFFRGVYSSNNSPSTGNKQALRCWTLQLPCRSKYYPVCFIANTDPVGAKGTHWIAIFVKNPRECDYFDSLGEYPNKDLLHYLKQFKRVNTINVMLQSPLSDSCGPYCVYFLVHRCAGWSFKNIVFRLFADPFRDTKVKHYAAAI